jgi:hypothetical protein
MNKLNNKLSLDEKEENMFDQKKWNGKRGDKAVFDVGDAFVLVSL